MAWDSCLAGFTSFSWEFMDVKNGNPWESKGMKSSEEWRRRGIFLGASNGVKWCKMNNCKDLKKKKTQPVFPTCLGKGSETSCIICMSSYKMQNDLQKSSHRSDDSIFYSSIHHLLYRSSNIHYISSIPRSKTFTKSKKWFSQPTPSIWQQ